MVSRHHYWWMDRFVAGQLAAPESDQRIASSPRSGALRWADLMRRTFGFDVLACPCCGGRLRLIALIEQASVIERILRHLGLPAEIPEPRSARAPPLPIPGRARHVGDAAIDFDPC